MLVVFVCCWLSCPTYHQLYRNLLYCGKFAKGEEASLTNKNLAESLRWDKILLIWKEYPATMH